MNFNQIMRTANVSFKNLEKKSGGAIYEPMSYYVLSHSAALAGYHLWSHQIDI